jgi:hypothetical protein
MPDPPPNPPQETIPAPEGGNGKPKPPPQNGDKKPPDGWDFVDTPDLGENKSPKK